MTAIKWTELLVTDGEGSTGETLGSMVAICPANLDDMTLSAEGGIAEWPSFFISAPGEEPGFDTPREPVDWTGFAEALGRSKSCGFLRPDGAFFDEIDDSGESLATLAHRSA